MNRAYSILTVKSIDEETRELDGMATTPSTDRMGDIVEPRGAEFKLPLPLLWQHMSDKPVGHVVRAKVTTAGIEVRAKFAKMAEPGALRDRLDEAWQSVKSGLVRGFSIGFRSLIDPEPIEDSRWGLRFTSWEWLELSLVTVPANADATIQTIKSIDYRLRVASDQRNGIVRLDQDFIRRVSRKPGVVYLGDTDHDARRTNQSPAGKA